MILATWLSEAAAEEQTSVLLVTLKVHINSLHIAYFYFLVTLLRIA